MGDQIQYYLLIIIIVFVQVTKAEEDEKPGSPPTSPLPGGVPPKPSSALKVSIPSELQGVAYIEVLCQKGIYLINNYFNFFFWFLFYIHFIYPSILY